MLSPTHHLYIMSYHLKTLDFLVNFIKWFGEIITTLLWISLKVLFLKELNIIYDISNTFWWIKEFIVCPLPLPKIRALIRCSMILLFWLSNIPVEKDYKRSDEQDSWRKQTPQRCLFRFLLFLISKQIVRKCDLVDPGGFS